MFTRWVMHHFQDADHARQTICTISGILAAAAFGMLLLGVMAMR
jgi:hypothetical protein